MAAHSLILCFAATAAIAANPTPQPKSDSLHDRARSLVAEGRLVEAKAAYRTLVEQQPSVSQYRYELGLLLSDSGELEAASTQFSEIIKREPTNAEAHYRLGVALYRSGKSTQAIDAIVEALRLKPD